LVLGGVGDEFGCVERFLGCPLTGICFSSFTAIADVRHNARPARKQIFVHQVRGD